ncbi:MULTISPECIES: hypothetical protein [unclassified Streptomyces]|uniref:hypothetical protein n=1 Tax=unclassified Streptomyces TaxID=2593676 RepID=UPI000A8F869C|nr:MULTISPECIES: hypothetical protein [unclassified Streptomyces]MBT2375961.1 hypothetical protein [Streptomyces sp. ISL-111]
MEVADADGVKPACFLIDAGPVNSPLLLERAVPACDQQHRLPDLGNVAGHLIRPAA